MWESLLAIKTFFCAYFNHTTAYKVPYRLTSIEYEAHTYVLCKYIGYSYVTPVYTGHVSANYQASSTAWEIATLHKKVDSCFLLGICMRIMCLTPSMWKVVDLTKCRSIVETMPILLWVNWQSESLRC